MTDARRRPTGPTSPSRTGSMLATVGCLGVLGLTFLGGFYSGRYWTRASLPPAALEGDSTAASASAARRGPGAAPAVPALTFYEELTAPLVAMPAAPKATPVEARRPAERPEIASSRPAPVRAP